MPAECSPLIYTLIFGKVQISDTCSSAFRNFPLCAVMVPLSYGAPSSGMVFLNV